MSHQIVPVLPASESTRGDASRSTWVYYPKNLLTPSSAESGKAIDAPIAKPQLLAEQSTKGNGDLEKWEGKEEDAFQDAHSLFQEVFFFCTVKKVGDVPGAGCIYVETVVDRDTGVAFAKVYSVKNAMNAVDILRSRVFPFFARQGVAIKEIHTRKTSEYCGLPLAHPFETFLATSHIEHLPKDQPHHPSNHLCEQFYQLLLKEFFLPALRRKFQLSLDELQQELDSFVEAYNAARMKQENGMASSLHPSANFSVDL